MRVPLLRNCRAAATVGLLCGLALALLACSGQSPSVSVGDPAVFTALHIRAAQASFEADEGRQASVIADMDRYFRTPVADYPAKKLRMDAMLDSTQRHRAIAQAVSSSLAIQLTANAAGALSGGAGGVSGATGGTGGASASPNSDGQSGHSGAGGSTGATGATGASGSSGGTGATGATGNGQSQKAGQQGGGEQESPTDRLAEAVAKSVDAASAPADGSSDSIDRAADFYTAYLLKSLRLYGGDSRVIPAKELYDVWTAAEILAAAKAQKAAQASASASNKQPKTEPKAGDVAMFNLVRSLLLGPAARAEPTLAPTTGVAQSAPKPRTVVEGSQSPKPTPPSPVEAKPIAATAIQLETSGSSPKETPKSPDSDKRREDHIVVSIDPQAYTTVENKRVEAQLELDARARQERANLIAQAEQLRQALNGPPDKKPGSGKTNQITGADVARTFLGLTPGADPVEAAQHNFDTVVKAARESAERFTAASAPAQRLILLLFQVEVHPGTAANKMTGVRARVVAYKLKCSCEQTVDASHPSPLKVFRLHPTRNYDLEDQEFADALTENLAVAISGQVSAGLSGKAAESVAAQAAEKRRFLSRITKTASWSDAPNAEFGWNFYPSNLQVRERAPLERVAGLVYGPALGRYTVDAYLEGGARDCAAYLVVPTNLESFTLEISHVVASLDGSDVETRRVLSSPGVWTSPDGRTALRRVTLPSYAGYEHAALLGNMVGVKETPIVPMTFQPTSDVAMQVR